MDHILIIEDDERVSELIARGLKEKKYETTIAYTGELGKSLALANQYDLIIIDIILPGIDGLKLCSQLRELNAEIPIIMLTALGTTDNKVNGFDAGANDYLVKPFDFRELYARIKALLKRTQKSNSLSSKILKIADLELNLKTKMVYRASEEIQLTPKEFKLLEYLLLNQGRVISRDEIAKEVWDTEFDTRTNFIDVYINYLRKKIDKGFDQKLIHTRSGMGFIIK